MKLRKILLMPDLHSPYEDKDAFACFLRVCVGWQPDTCVCLGDFADFYKVSSYNIDPRRKLSFRDEIYGAREARWRLDGALKAGGCKDKRFLQGNHEVRLESYLVKGAPAVVELLDEENVNWHGLLKLKDNGWKTKPYKESIQIGHLRMTHDVGRAGVNAARQSLLDVGENIAFGHTHRIQVVYQGTVTGRKLVGATLGWLGDPEAIDYRHRDQIRRDSIHGFGAVYMMPNGLFWLNAVPIVKGRCVLDGVLY